MATALTMAVEVDPEAIRLYRRARKYTQREMADRLGISIPTYQAIESGRQADPGVRTLGQIASILGVKLMQLVRED